MDLGLSEILSSQTDHSDNSQVEPAVGAALLAWNYLMKQSEGNRGR